jgi:type IX secretion system substrate protein
MRKFNSLFISIIFLLVSLNVKAQDGGVNFRGEMPVWIKNNSGSPMVGVQVPIRVNTQALIALGLMQANGNDIRFGIPCSFSPNTFYSYWIEGYINTDSTKIWVASPTVPANDSVLIFMFFGVSSLPAGSSLAIFSGPHSSTDSVVVTSGPGVALSQRGFRFTPTQSLLVTHFGNRNPQGTQRYVTLFDFNSQAIVYQTQVAAGPIGVWHYDLLTQPFWVNSGQQYVLELFQGSGDGYYFGVSSQIGQHMTYGDMRYCNSCTQNTFPTSTLTNYHYGTPDLLYYVRNDVTPAPGFSLRPPADTNSPAAPTNLTGTPGNQQVFLRWNRNAEFDMFKYFVYRNTTNNPATSTLIDSTLHPDTMRTATGLTNGTTYYFWVRALDRYCSGRISGYSNVLTITPTALSHNENRIPKVFALHQNYPNPFNPVTTIKFELPKGNLVTLTVFDITGREVETPISEYLAAGYYEVTFEAENLASGVYVYKLEAGTFTDKKKMIILK